MAITCYRIPLAYILFRYFLFIPVFTRGAGYDLPVLPDLKTMFEALKTLDGPYSNISALTADQKSHQIPKLFFLTMKRAPETHHNLPGHIKQYLGHNDKWLPIIADDFYANKFMTTAFANTSTLWAYQSINPVLGAAKADIWRYAVLYAYGGVYIDADAGFKGHLDHFIQPSDKFIIATERNPIQFCYDDAKYPPVAVPPVFKNHIMLQWMLFSTPQHPFMAQTMTNVVHVIKSLYRNESVLLPTVADYRVLLCSTGPPVFTRAVSQIMNTLPAETLGFRFAGVDYEPLKGKYNAANEPENPKHYTNLMTAGTPLLLTLEKH